MPDLPPDLEGCPMSGLSDLLQHLNTEGWSSRRIEREAASHGHQLSNATAAKYIRGDHPDRPGADTLQALADVFSVNVDRLREAAGLPGAGQHFDLGADAARLTGPQREAIRTTVRLFVEQNDKLADLPVPDGATTELDARASGVDTNPGGSEADANAYLLQRRSINAEPTKADYGRAAMAGTSDLERLDAEAGERGEGSQDPEDWTL